MYRKASALEDKKCIIYTSQGKMLFVAILLEQEFIYTEDQSKLIINMMITLILWLWYSEKRNLQIDGQKSHKLYDTK